MEDDEGLYAALRKVNRAGVVLLENVGVKEKTVLDLARRVAPISHQALYGEHFDVVSQVYGRKGYCREDTVRGGGGTFFRKKCGTWGGGRFCFFCRFGGVVVVCRCQRGLPCVRSPPRLCC